MTDDTPQGPVLSARLRAVADCVIPGLPVADVGTDHALLPISLVRRGVVPSAVAIDRLKAPLARAEAEVARWGLGAQVSLRLGDGLDPLRVDDAATVVVAGVGASMIGRILARADLGALGVQRLVLQPHTEVEVLRRWTVQRWALTGESLVEQGGRFYVTLVLSVTPATARFEEADLCLGPVLRRRGGAVFARYVRARLRQVERRARGLEAATRPDPQGRAALERARRLYDAALRHELGEDEGDGRRGER